jgi:hypothetical protein
VFVSPVALRTRTAEEAHADSETVEQDDIVRVSTELVQTDVMVFDKDGKYMVGPNDQVTITSASGEICFLRQLTNNPIVLRAALDRLKMVGRATPEMNGLYQSLRSVFNSRAQRSPALRLLR